MRTDTGIRRATPDGVSRGVWVWGAENATSGAPEVCTILQRRFGVAPGEHDHPGTDANEIGNE